MTELPRLSAMASRSTTSSNPVRRMFTAVTPPPQAVARLEDLLEPGRLRWPKLRWTKPSGWHLTCAFMARVDAAGYTRLDELLTDLAAATARFGLGLAGAGAFPAPGLAKALWLGADDPGGELAALARGCRTAARRAGISVADEPFVGHLTIARYRHPADARPQIDALDATTIEPWPVTEIVLIESLLGQGDDGSVRSVVRERYPLSSY